MSSEAQLKNELKPEARLIIGLNALYNVAESLCSVFVSVYLYLHSMDLNRVFLHYTTLYAVTPVVFILAGWYAKSRDRSHVFRIGLALHAVYYALLLYLREASPDYVILLGALLGVTWGFFWAGNNTFQFDYSEHAGRREYFLGLISSVSSASRLIAPLASGAVIALAPTRQTGYHLIFFIALLIYLTAIGLSFYIPHAKSSRPFHLKKALFPPKEHRDWRLVMLASASLAGSFHIFHFLLAIVLFTKVGSEAGVGGYVSLQGLVSVTVSFLVGRFVVPQTRSSFMFWGMAALATGGVLITWKLSVATLILFAFLRSVSLPLFGIPHMGIRFEVMQRTIVHPSERIEYLCAWETPLAVGRIAMMIALMLLYAAFGEAGLRAALLMLCLNRIATYWLLRRISFVRDPSLSLQASAAGGSLPQSDQGE